MRGKLRAMAVCAAVVVGFTMMASEKPSPEYQTAMKNLGTANGALRGNITAKDYPAIEANAATIQAPRSRSPTRSGQGKRPTMRSS